MLLVVTSLQPPPLPMPSLSYYYPIAAVLTTISSPCHFYTFPPLLPGHSPVTSTIFIVPPCQLLQYCHHAVTTSVLNIFRYLFLFLNNLSNIILTIWHPYLSEDELCYTYVQLYYKILFQTWKFSLTESIMTSHLRILLSSSNTTLVFCK